MQSDREELQYEMFSKINGEFEELLSYMVEVDNKMYKVKIWDRQRIGITEETNG